MAKKTKKSQRPRAQRRPVPQTTFDRPVKAVAAPVQKEAAAATTYKRGQMVDFKQEYHYVLKDLRRLGIIAAVMLVVLVVLSLLVA
ncbi:MAG: hypothetical protein QHH80_00920 [Anaerolineae bacterium]|jgi:negative regulator of sigma E activity|nr:hypothetical protein [Anaerolineae bacterium]